MLSNLFGTNAFLDLMGSFAFWATMLLIIGLIITIVVCIKNPKVGGPMLACLFCLALIGADVFCLVQLNIYFNAEGGIHGFITGIFDTNKITVVDNFTFKVEDIELTEQAEGIYSASITTDRVISADTKENLGVFVNGTPCDTTSEVDKAYVIANYTYTFYDTDKSVILTDTLTINIAFYGNSTTLSLSTKGGTLPVEDCIKYWHNYFNKNGFEVKVAPFEDVSASPDYSTGDTSNYVILNYYVDNEIYSSVCANVGETVEIVALENSSFLGWYTADEELIADSIVLNESLNLYAKMADETTNAYSVSFNMRGNISTDTFYEGQTFTPPTAYVPEGYTFVGWTTSQTTTQTINVSTYTLTEDVTLYALYSKTTTVSQSLSITVDEMTAGYSIDLDNYATLNSLINDYVSFDISLNLTDVYSGTSTGKHVTSGYSNFSSNLWGDSSITITLDSENVLTLNPYGNSVCRADSTGYRLTIYSIVVYEF